MSSVVDYLDRFDAIRNLGTSATQYEEQRQARIKAQQEALKALQLQAQMNKQFQVNVVDGENYESQGPGGQGVPGRQFSMFPLKGFRITSKYGPRKHPVHGRHSTHTGIDFAAKRGTPIYAVADGTVRLSDFHKIYGYRTVLNFGGGIASMYGHQSRSVVRAGQRIKRGQLIGYVGSTGLSTGPHLHFETWVNNRPVNPLSWFNW